MAAIPLIAAYLIVYGSIAALFGVIVLALCRAAQEDRWERQELANRVLADRRAKASVDWPGDASPFDFPVWEPTDEREIAAHASYTRRGSAAETASRTTTDR